MVRDSSPSIVPSPLRLAAVSHGKGSPPSQLGPARIRSIRQRRVQRPWSALAAALTTVHHGFELPGCRAASVTFSSPSWASGLHVRSGALRFQCGSPWPPEGTDGGTVCSPCGPGRGARSLRHVAIAPQWAGDTGADRRREPQVLEPSCLRHASVCMGCRVGVLHRP
jgi:hypothetical protein